MVDGQLIFLEAFASKGQRSELGAYLNDSCFVTFRDDEDFFQ